MAMRAHSRRRHLAEADRQDAAKHDSADEQQHHEGDEFKRHGGFPRLNLLMATKAKLFIDQNHGLTR